MRRVRLELALLAASVLAVPPSRPQKYDDPEDAERSPRR
jgi:hypothetical protein